MPNENTDILISTMKDDENNILSSVMASSLGVKNTIARVRKPEYLKSINVTAESIEFSCMLGDNSIKVKNIRIHARNNITDKNEVINGLKRYLDVDCDIELIV